MDCEETWWGRWLSEPAIHFVLLGALVFAVDSYRSPDTERDEIVVTERTVEGLRGNYEKTHGRPPDTETTRQLIDEHVSEEILYREGLALGLHESDTIIRRRIIQSMRFLTEDLNPLEEPSDAELEQYYEAHREQYRTNERFWFQHVFFREDADEERIQEALRALKRGANYVGLGGPFAHGRSFSGSIAATVENRFGEEFVTALRDAPIEKWHGPIASSYGRHLVHLTEYRGAAVPAFESVRRSVLSDWREERREKANRRAVDNLRDDYDVQVEWSDP